MKGLVFRLQQLARLLLDTLLLLGVLGLGLSELVACLLQLRLQLLNNLLILRVILLKLQFHLVVRVCLLSRSVKFLV